MSKPNIKFLLFDTDDTLLDFQACEKEALRLVFEKYGYELNDEVKQRYERINHGLWKQYEQGLMDRHTVIYSRFGLLFQELGIENDGIVFEDDYQELLGMQHVYIEDALETVMELSKNFELYIVTNGVTVTQYRRLRESKIEQYVKKIFVSEETGYQKPMKEYFNYCFERIEDFDIEKAMIIGDSLSSDMKGGNNAGLTTCWYNPKGFEKPEEIKIDYEIKSLKELFKILV